MGKLGNQEIDKDERLFEEKIKNLKYKREIKSTLSMEGLQEEIRSKSLHKPCFYASPSTSDARLVTILILHLILPP